MRIKLSKVNERLGKLLEINESCRKKFINKENDLLCREKFETQNKVYKTV